METSLSAPIDLFWSIFSLAIWFYCHLIEEKKKNNQTPLSHSRDLLMNFSEIALPWTPHWSPSGLVCFFFFFYRLMTSQRLRTRPKIYPRRIPKGSEWWSSRRARRTRSQLLVGHLCFCLLVCTHFHLSTSQSQLLGPFGRLYPQLKPHISDLQNAASNRW